ncbi:homoserine O-acetyltransferase [Brevibacillus humidisoli]|uniref:homoserine O-acetyltransferase MetX n=1 Tax=Brevibacillus humidisoli TaxID=2895522 RepID=UPI001E53C17F|nr:homoserine O-acetyltransferase [Brevibacillus humidisoli]UFJ39120.1 homoserine O-acetyltransferase [Brevibacillus humidisoli]
MKKLVIGDIELESGEVLKEVEVGYETHGTYDKERGNAVLICHALTGDVHVAGDESQAGWWEGLVGPGMPIDTNQYYVICCNVLGGCYGTTGPASINPDTGKPYGSSFPMVSIRDMVHTQHRFLQALGIEQLYAVVGGSMGGMQVYEWAITYPTYMKMVVPIATCTRFSAIAIAYNDVGRQAIVNDPAWQGGDYYPGPGPTSGLAVARMLGMITYRTAELFEERFGRSLQEQADSSSFDTPFQIESYLRYQGEKLVERFDANSYLCLLKAMDTHDVGRNRGGIEHALSGIKAQVVGIGISNDLLYPLDHQREMVDVLRTYGIRADFYTIDSKYGHDGFLVEFHKMGNILAPYFA